ncbi:MAG TPA: protein kinase, partial [Polyangiaceae bacterium]|nr:protein kinase [Polyangiaceae bacterium]
PQYMSPEQLRARPDLDARTDIWSLGVILYQLVSGTLPFQGESFPELCANIIAGSPGSVAEMPSELGSVLRRCLEKAREARFAGVHELEQALLPLAPVGVRRARAEKTVRKPLVPEPRLTASDPALEMPSTVLQRFDSSVTSLGGTATASVALRDSPRSKQIAFALVGVFVLFAAATLARRLRGPAPAPDQSTAALATVVQPSVAAQRTASVEPVRAASAAALPVEVAKSDARPVTELPRRPTATSRPRALASSAAAASASAPVPMSSAFSRSAMGGRL